jgi:hypothetical protein
MSHLLLKQQGYKQPFCLGNSTSVICPATSWQAQPSEVNFQIHMEICALHIFFNLDNPQYLAYLELNDGHPYSTTFFFLNALFM